MQATNPLGRTNLQRLIVCVSLTALLLAGCLGRKGPDQAIADANSTNIQRLANLYFTYQMKHDWQGPPDEVSFREFLKAYSPQKLERIGIDPAAIDDLFISERDGQPFNIRYSVTGSMMGSNEPVIFESEGIRGQRMVGFLDMEQREVDESEYDDLWSGKIQPTHLSRE